MLYVALFLIQFILDESLDSDKVCDDTWYKLFKGKIDSDIIILGNSRAEAHYNPKIIESITKHSVYNLGLSGTPLNILMIRWRAYINRNKLPKLLIIDVGYNVLGTSRDLFEKFQYLPYTDTNEYQEVAKNIDEDYYYEKIIPMYKYRDYEMQVYNKLKLIDENVDCINIFKGYKPHDKTWDENNWRIYNRRMLNDSIFKNNFSMLYKNGIEELSSIIRFCKKNTIEVCLVWSPQFFKVHKFRTKQRIYIDSVISEIALRNNLKYINFLKEDFVYDKTYFYDKSHLNLQGSEMFSEKIGIYLSNEIFNDTNLLK